jgi:predicted RNase H-like HicB family nuclease
LVARNSIAIGTTFSLEHGPPTMASSSEMKYLVLFEQGPTTVGASVPDLPGCFAVGQTRQEAERLIEEAIVGHISSLRELGEPVPAPATQAITLEVNVKASA